MSLADQEGGGTSLRPVAEFSYSGASRLTGVGHADGSVWTGGEWDAAGRRLRGTVTAGATEPFVEELRYDADDRVTRVVWAHGRSGPEKEAQTYAYDEQGRLTGFQQGNWDDAVQGLTGSLTAAHDYTLDDQGNWREHRDGDSSTPVLVPPIDKINAYEEWKVPQKLSGGGTGVKTLDLKYSRVLGFLWERELRNGDKVHYQHDGLGRLVSVKQESTVLVRYGYDAEGRLAWRKAGTNPREWLVYDGDRVLQEVRESAQGGGPFVVVQEYTWSGNQLERSYDGSGNEYFLHQDRLGSVVWATRKDGGVTIKTGHAAYDPYGRPVTLPGQGPNSLPVPYGYAGARFEDIAAPDEDITLDGAAEKLGLYLMGARWYDPELGRFLEQDPIAEAGGLNLYNYVNSSPTLLVDPTGHYPSFPPSQRDGRILGGSFFPQPGMTKESFFEPPQESAARFSKFHTENGKNPFYRPAQGGTQDNLKREVFPPLSYVEPDWFGPLSPFIQRNPFEKRIFNIFMLLIKNPSALEGILLLKSHIEENYPRVEYLCSVWRSKSSHLVYPLISTSNQKNRVSHDAFANLAESIFRADPDMEWITDIHSHVEGGKPLQEDLDLSINHPNVEMYILAPGGFVTWFKNGKWEERWGQVF